MGFALLSAGDWACVSAASACARSNSATCSANSAARSSRPRTSDLVHRGVEITSGDGARGAQLLRAIEILLREFQRAAGAFNLRLALHLCGFRAFHARLGFHLGAGVEKCGQLRVHRGEHGFAGFDGCAGAERDALEQARDRRRNDVAMANARLAFLEHGDGERCGADGVRLHFERLGTQAHHDARHHHGEEDPREEAAPGAILSRSARRRADWWRWKRVWTLEVIREP